MIMLITQLSLARSLTMRSHLCSTNESVAGEFYKLDLKVIVAEHMMPREGRINDFDGRDNGCYRLQLPSDNWLISSMVIGR